MQPTVLQEIIAKLLVLTDAVLGVFVGPATLTAGNLASCGGATLTAGNLTACGQTLITQLTTLIVQGVGFLGSTLTALSTISK